MLFARDVVGTATPWDEALGATMTAADVAVHEELTVDMLLSDLR
jgi:hypothetical protein